MRILLEHQESEELFYDALCNGIYELDNYGIKLVYDEDSYKQAKETLKKAKPNETICYEDVLMQILKQGDSITAHDSEECEPDSRITIEDVWNRVSETPIEHLTDAIQENGDATTADVILQTVFFKDIIYG